MAFNQFSNQTQAMASPPLPPLTINSQMMNSHVNDQQPHQQQLDHVYPVPDPNNQAPTPAIPNFSASDLLSEWSQLSLELNNQRAVMEEQNHLQYLQTVDAVRIVNTNQDVLLQNYVSKLVGCIHGKEEEVVELRRCLMDLDFELKAVQQIALEKEATVENLNHQLEMIQESHQMMMNANEPDADSSYGDNLSKGIIDGNCQRCHTELSSVIIFPCKHLCICKPCEAYVHSCPVCEIVKESSVEISWPLMKKQ